MNDKIKNLPKILLDLVMGIIWISFGGFWLIYNRIYPTIKLRELGDHPFWPIFNVLCIFYGLWRFKRAYDKYKGYEY